MENYTQNFIDKHKIPPLGFGLMRLPTLGADDQIDVEEVKKLVDAYMAAGFNYFDTAYFYHGGKSEIAVKEAVTKRYPREDFILVDKLAAWSVETEADVEKVFNEQLDRCGVTHFDIYLLHAINGKFNEKLENLRAYEFCAKMKAEGKIKSFGFSFHGTTDDLRHILKHHHEQIDVIQLQLNYFDWLGEYREQFEIAASYNKPVICMEPVRGGMLSRLPEKIGDILTQANPAASHASWALRWVASTPGIVNVLSGMSNIEQVNDNLATFKNLTLLNEAEHATIDKVAAALKSMPLIACTSCNYCKNCPQNINIPKIFELYNKFLDDRGMYSFNAAYKKEIEADKKAAACTACGICVGVCPQNIDIPTHLKEISTLFDQ